MIIYKTNNHDHLYIIFHLLIGILQLLLSSIPFRFSRLKKGMPFILQKSSNTAGVFISIFILTAASFWGIKKENNFLISLSIICVIVCGLLLIIWWRKQLTATYLKKLQLKEINELKHDIFKLKKENEELSKIIHKDNKLIPAMEIAVQELISYSSKELSGSDMMRKSIELLEELRKLSSERKDILSSYETKAAFPLTGYIRIDSVLHYMEKIAISNDITFNFSLNCNLKYMLNNIIYESSLSTLIADLTENSIIASKNQQIRNILLCLNIKNNNYCLNIFDTGSLFEPDVIINLGKFRFTTHADTGGSGIGLMSILEIVQKYNASFCIDETLVDTLYTKKISICFNCMNQISVKSTRAELNNISCIRQDIIFEKP